MDQAPQSLCAFIDASPSPFHVCQTVAGRLRDAGFTELAEGDQWPSSAGDYFTVRAGSLRLTKSRMRRSTCPARSRGTSVFSKVGMERTRVIACTSAVCAAKLRTRAATRRGSATTTRPAGRGGHRGALQSTC